MNQNDIDEKIAMERHVASDYTSYSNQTKKRTGRLKSNVLGYTPKKAIIFGALGGLILIIGIASSIMKLNDHNNAQIAKTDTNKTSTETNRDGSVAIEDPSADSLGADSGVQSDNQDTPPSTSDQSTAVDDAFLSLGLTENSTPTAYSSSSDSQQGSTTSSPSTPATTTHTPQAPSPQPRPAPQSKPVPKVTKLLVFVEENHSLQQMKTSMPYAFGLAKKYGYATNYYAIRHPSLPNYIAITTGSTRGITNDNLPSSNSFSGTSVFGQAIRSKKTAAAYAESMGTNCRLSGDSSYFVRHNPWTYLKNERSWCQKFDLPINKFAAAASSGRLPNVGMVIPNACNDAHDCSLKTADNWFKTRMSQVFNGPDWKSGHLAVVLTADEDDRRSDNKVLTVVIHPSQKSHTVSCRLTHYSLSQLYSNVLHVSPILNAKSAPSMSKCFNLPL